MTLVPRLPLWIESLLPYILKGALGSLQHEKTAEHSNSALILGPVSQAVQTAALFAYFDRKKMSRKHNPEPVWLDWCSPLEFYTSCFHITQFVLV